MLSDLGDYMLNKVDSREATYNLEVYYTNQFLDSMKANSPDPTNSKDAASAFLKAFHKV